jgi:hypothetical protein
VSAKGKEEGGRQEDGKCPLRLRSKRLYHKGLARVTTKEWRQVTKRKRVATTLDDKDNVDQRKENPYGIRAFTCQWYAESGLISEHVGEVSRERRG